MVHSFMDNAVQAILPTQYKRRYYQPGKKTILISVMLSILLLLSQIFSSFNIGKPPKITFHGIYKSSDALIEDLDTPSCLKNFLGSEKPPAKPTDTCHHIIPPRGICSLYQELFHHNSPESCSHEKEVQFCNLQGGHINCTTPEECENKRIYIGVFNHESGDTVWEETRIDLLKQKIYSVAHANHYKGYIFIKCSDDAFRQASLDVVESEKNSIEVLDHTQLFLYHRVSSTGLDVNQNRTLYPNINMIMIDSLSRNHFFRSLPQTINLLEKIKGGSTHTVVDFHYFQALKQRTFENYQALFSGFVDVLVKPFRTQSMPHFPLPFEVLLKKFKDKGYETLWLEDMCWKWEWGLAKDLKVVNKSLNSRELWESFQKSLRKAMIDRVDITLSSCDILKANKLNDPFHKAPAVCFNGKYHHEYIFEYLQLYQKSQQQPAAKSSFSFTVVDVSHEETGVRVQSLDHSLRTYLENVQRLRNTITILFSDHGNSYGTYLEKSPEAYVETFSPFLIFVIPNGVAKAIGDKEMKLMEENSQHLVSLIDVHETLLALIQESNDKRHADFNQKYVIPGGLFGSVPPKRTCNDLPLIMPNLCICKDFDISVQVNDFHYAYAEFSVGVINNFMLRERVRSRKHGFGRCQLLRVKSVRSARELKKTADLTQFKLDVAATGVLSSVVELFFFTVEIGFGHPSIRLISFERNSPYGNYQSCKDENIDPRMCTCKLETKKTKMGLWHFFLPDFFTLSSEEFNQESKQSQKQMQAFIDDSSPRFSTHIDRTYPKENPCLLILRHQYENSFNIFGLNLCSTFHKVTFEVASENLLLSDDLISRHILHPFDVKHLIGGTQANLKSGWFWDYTILIV